MHHLSPLSPEAYLSGRSPGCQDQVRFFALLELNHTPLLGGPPSILLSFNLAIVPPGGILIVLTAHGRGQYLTPSIHRLRRGLPGYLILFAPTRSSASVKYPAGRLHTGVPPNIYAFHRYTGNSCLSITQDQQF